jgi:hypothetical protein
MMIREILFAKEAAILTEKFVDLISDFAALKSVPAFFRDSSIRVGKIRIFE